MLFVGRTRYRLPLPPSLAEKFEALGGELDVRVLASALPGSAPGDRTFTLVQPFPLRRLDGLAFWLALPMRIARLLRDFRPDAVVCQTAYDAAAALLARRIARVPARVVVEVHGDWRTATRLYGSPARRRPRQARRRRRRRGAPPRGCGAHRLAVHGRSRARARPRAERRLSRVHGPRARSPGRPCRFRLEPTALFVGVLEAYKNVDGLARAWRLAAPRVPDASLRLVGEGTRSDVAEALVREHGARWDRELPSAGVAAALDDAWVLVLPSRSEGMGRVLVEAFCRGRGVVGTRAGSIPDLVADGVSGLLVEPDDPAALADALVRVLSDRAARAAARRGGPRRGRAVAPDAGGVRARACGSSST